jgi:hypothetical protein
VAQGFNNRRSTFNGKLKSLHDGSFGINVSIVPLLAPIRSGAIQLELRNAAVAMRGKRGTIRAIRG